MFILRPDALSLNGSVMIKSIKSNQINAHHRFGLLRARLGISLAGLAKSLTRSLQRGLVNLAIAFDDAYGCTSAVGEGGDLLGALVPTHRCGAIEEGLGEHNGLIGSHVEAIGKCLVVEWCNSLLVDV
jgi:hypothetical protein